MIRSVDIFKLYVSCEIIFCEVVEVCCLQLRGLNIWYCAYISNPLGMLPVGEYSAQPLVAQLGKFLVNAIRSEAGNALQPGQNQWTCIRLIKIMLNNISLGLITMEIYKGWTELGPCCSTLSMDPGSAPEHHQKMVVIKRSNCWSANFKILSPWHPTNMF